MNKIIQNSHRSIWFIQTSDLLHYVLCSENTSLQQFISFRGLRAILFTFHYIKLCTSDILTVCLWQKSLFASTCRPFAWNSWAMCQRKNYLMCERCLNILPKLQKEDFMDNFILNLWIGLELENYPNLNSALLCFLKKIKCIFNHLLSLASWFFSLALC